MKLRMIAEKADKKAIMKSAQALGDLVQYVLEAGAELPEYKDLMIFLAEPGARSWDATKWIVDSLIQQTTQTGNPDNIDRAKGWAILKQFASPVIATAAYDMSPEAMKGTPMANLGVNQSTRDKFKKAVGPQGYVGALSNANIFPQSKLKKMMKNTAANANEIVSAAKDAGFPVKQEKF